MYFRWSCDDAPVAEHFVYKHYLNSISQLSMHISLELSLNLDWKYVRDVRKGMPERQLTDKGSWQWLLSVPLIAIAISSTLSIDVLSHTIGPAVELLHYFKYCRFQHSTASATFSMFLRHLIGKLPTSFAASSNVYRLSTVAHVNNVKNKIEEKRRSALLGGGLKRIEQQHAKVTSMMFCLLVVLSSSPTGKTDITWENWSLTGSGKFCWVWHVRWAHLQWFWNW